jgi:CRISPR-associated endonuclease Csy4
MKYYQEITLLPDQEVSANFLWQKLYRQVHYGLATLKNKGIEPLAVSFPDYDIDDKRCKLGLRLRLFSAEKEALEAFDSEGRFKALKDYVLIEPIKITPPTDSYVAFIKKPGIGRNKSKYKNKKNLAFFEKKNLSSNDKSSKTEFSEKHYSPSKLPFIWMESDTTKAACSARAHRFPLFIEKNKAEAKGKEPASSYGLSTASHIVGVPDF